MDTNKPELLGSTLMRNAIAFTSATIFAGIAAVVIPLSPFAGSVFMF